ncbi:signal peptidase II [Candidatus Falkowbacteria bacterium]|nr:signal peptidase II [Candidatus Falkowbacteria bacterium]
MFKSKVIIANGAAAVLLVIDQLLKQYFVANPDTMRDFILFKLQLWHNPGLAFGLVIDPDLILVLVAPFTLIILMLLTWELVKQYRAKNIMAISCLTLVIGGALSNFWDRLSGQSVVDYINFNFWPIFNLADAMIVLGIIGLFLNTLRRARQP